MMKDDRVRKRCSACGTAGWYRVKARACGQKERNAQGFTTGWRCPGKLVKVTRPKAAKAKPSGYDVAKRKHASARGMVEKYSTDLRRTATLLHKWIRKERYYTERMAEAAAAVQHGLDAGIARTIVLPDE